MDGKLNRFLAYLLIAVIGFIVGVVLYYLGTLAGKLVIQLMPSIVEWIRQPLVIGAVLSGVVGAFLALVLAYMWATKYE